MSGQHWNSACCFSQIFALEYHKQKLKIRLYLKPQTDATFFLGYACEGYMLE